MATETAAVVARTRADVRTALGGTQAIADGDLRAREVPTGRDELGDLGPIETARNQLAEAFASQVRRVEDAALGTVSSIGEIRAAAAGMDDVARVLADQVATFPS